MSTSIKKKLHDALEISHNLEKDQRSSQKIQRSLEIIKQKDYKVGDENGVYTIALNHDGSKAAVGLGSGSFTVYDCKKTWDKLRRIRTDCIVSLPLLALKFYPCQAYNALYTGSSDGTVKAWNLDTFSHGENIIEEPGNQITSLDFSSDGFYFATSGKDCNVRVYHTDNLKILKTYTGSNNLEVESFEDLSIIPGHSKKVFAVKFHPEDRNVFLTASWDHSIKIWDLRTDHALRTVNGPFVCGDGIDIHHGKILSASWVAQDALQLWDYGSGKLIQSLTWPTVEHRGEYLYCARYWDQDHVVAGGSGTNDLKLICVSNDSIEGAISGDEHPVQAVEVMESKNFLVCGTSANLLRTATLSDANVHVESQAIMK